MTRAQEVLNLLARYPAGLTIGVIASSLNISTKHTRKLVSELFGQVQVRTVQRKHHVALTTDQPDAPAAPTPTPPPATSPDRPGPINLARLTGHHLSAARLLNALTADKRSDPRFLACHFGCTYSRARQLHAEIMDRAG